ncbi:MAG: Gfo/Idh/MocA family oxidoreductase [Lentisphaeria bacterium]|nr:Gfo/Idh/MocA family oxidoreductase [Lentisphaeria bacterium]
MPIKAAVVGMGGIGYTHAKVYATDPLAELIAVCDINREKADKAAEDFGVKAYYSQKEMIEDLPDLEAVSICTSGLENGSFHFEPAMEALSYGKKVLCEKPLCADIRDARELVGYALKNRLYLGCDLNHYFTEIAAKAKGWQTAGEIGETVYCLHKVGPEGSDYNYRSTPDPRSRWMPPYSHCKAFLTHPFSVMRYFCGDITHVQAFLDRPGVRRTAGDPMLSINSVNCKFANGGVGVLISQRGDARFGLGGWWSYEHCGTKGTFCIENCVEQLTYWRGKKVPDAEGREVLPPPEVINTGIKDFGATFPVRIHAWLEDLTNNVSYEFVRASGRDALATLEYIEAVIQSYENGGALVRPNPLPPIHGTPEYIH